MKLNSLQWLPLGIVFLVFRNTELRSLNDLIKHYETLSYNAMEVHNQHVRSKRSPDQPTTISIKFTAHGRNFKLNLIQDNSVFSRHIHFEVNNGAVPSSDLSHIYTGHEEDDEYSQVSGSIIGGIFTGVIHLADRKFYVEKADRYFNHSQLFHSIIYDDRDAWLQEKETSIFQDQLQSSCGTTNQETLDWMAAIQNSEVPGYSMMDDEQSHVIHKRQTADKKRTCALYLRSDPELWKYLTINLGYDTTQAEQELTATFAQHVIEVNSIYQTTKFNSSDPQSSPPYYTGINFTIRRITLLTTSICSDPSKVGYQLCDETLNVAQFLYSISVANYNDFCLAFTFTYRDFRPGLLGLAWVGSPTAASGGICETYKQYSESGNLVWMTLNTGLITYQYYGITVPTKLTNLAFAHEIGHGFGSLHDNTSYVACYGDDQNGHFIMYGRAATASKPNNRKFSACSLHSVYDLLTAILAGTFKTMCLVQEDQPFCGNQVVDPGEQCDCGYAPCVQDQCCYGRSNYEGGIVYGNVTNQCTLVPNAVCSPSEGDCCAADCSIVTQPVMCAMTTDCAAASYCNGNQPDCPTPTPMPDNLLCNQKTQICRNGMCTLSLCQHPGLNWTQCFLTSGDLQPDTMKNLCYLACFNPATNTCVSSSPSDSNLQKPENRAYVTFLQKYSDSVAGVGMPVDTECDNYQGNCDKQQNCQYITISGSVTHCVTQLLFCLVIVLFFLQGLDEFVLQQ